MNESIKRYMRPGIIHFMAFPETMSGEGKMLDTIRTIAYDNYFEAIEISWIKDATERAAVKKLLDTCGISVAYGSSPRLLTTGLNINDTNEEGRKRAVATLKEGIDEAYEMGAEAFSYLSGKYTQEQFDEAYDALVASTIEICEYAALKGDLKIALEVFDYDVDKKSIIGPAALAKKFAREITDECYNFGLLVDLSHMPLLRESPTQSIFPVKDYIIHGHMGNAVVLPGYDGYGDLHPRFGFPMGSNNVRELVDFLRILLEVGFLNEEDPPIVSFEVKPFGDEDPLAVIANAKRTLDKAWALV